MNVTDFLFESVYQVVTWVFIGLSIGGIWYFASQGNKKLVMWSIIMLICSSAVMIGIIADRQFFRPSSVNKVAQTGQAGSAPDQQSLYLSQRAYLKTTVFEIRGIGLGETPQVDIRTENVGKSPAHTNIKHTIALYPTDRLPDNLRELAEADWKAQKGQGSTELDIMPGEVIGSLPTLHAPLTAQQWALLKSKAFSIHIYSWGEYSDGFGHTHPVEQCWFYDLDRPTILRNCSRYNKAEE